MPCFPSFFLHAKCDPASSPKLFCKENTINLQSFFCCFLQVQYFEMKDFQEYFLRLWSHSIEPWRSSCTRMSQEKQLKQLLHKNVPRKTIEAVAAQECLRKQLKQQLHNNIYKNNRSNNCTRMSKNTVEAATVQECPRKHLKQHCTTMSKETIEAAAA